jgi:hypothetical protein
MPIYISYVSLYRLYLFRVWAFLFVRTVGLYTTKAGCIQADIPWAQLQ